MKFLLKLVLIAVANAAGLWLAARYVTGFHLAATPGEFAVLVVIFTFLNSVVKPVLKFFLSPFIILTLGLLLFVINALLLYILDILSPQLTIDTVAALLLSTIVVGAVNWLAHLIDA